MKIDFIVDLEILTLSLVTFLIVIIYLSKHIDMTLMVMNNVEKKNFQRRCVCLRPEGKTIKIDFILDLQIFTLNLVTFLIVIR